MRGPVAESLLSAWRRVVPANRRARVIATHLADTMPHRGSVLDLGCGDGAVARALMDLRPDLKVEGADLHARPRVGIRVTRCDGARLPFEDGRFDYVAIVDVLHQTEDPAAVLAEASRVARQGVALKDYLLEGLMARPTLHLLEWIGSRERGAVKAPTYLTRKEWQGVFYRARLKTVTSTARLGLYPPPLGWLFDRNLHFVAFLTPRDGAS